MRILGVDPGLRITGFGVLEQCDQRAILLDHGVLRLSQREHIAGRVGSFFQFFSCKVSAWRIDAISLETPFLGKNAQNFLKLGYLRGLLYLLSDQYDLRILEFSPREVKQSVAGFGGADKQRIAHMVSRFFPSISRPSCLDETDAIAVGLCGLWSIRSSFLL